MPWIHLTDEAAEGLANRHKNSRSKHDKSLLDAIKMFHGQRGADPAYLIERAKEEYAHGSSDNVEVDEEAAMSVGDDGTWVMAWVWLATDEPKPCTRCHGDSRVPDPTPDPVSKDGKMPCPHCEGSGEEPKPDSIHDRAVVVKEMPDGE